MLGRGQSGPAALGGDPELSREHASVQTFEGGQLLIEDLGSTNGTFVNGGPVAGPTVLEDGDVIWLGTTTLLVRGTDAALPEVAPVEPPTPSPQGGFLARLAELAVRRPKRMLIGLGVFFLFAVALGGPVTQQLRDEGGFIDPGQESAKAEEAIAAASGNTPGIRTVILFRAGRDVVKDPDVKREVLALKRKLESNEAVAGVITFYDFRDALFTSRDGRSTYLGVQYKNVGQEKREEVAEELESELEKPPEIVSADRPWSTASCARRWRVTCARPRVSPFRSCSSCRCSCSAAWSPRCCRSSSAWSRSSRASSCCGSSTRSAVSTCSPSTS